MGRIPLNWNRSYTTSKPGTLRVKGSNTLQPQHSISAPSTTPNPALLKYKQHNRFLELTTATFTWTSLSPK